MLQPKTGFVGYNRRRCALWQRHASACAAQHAALGRLGIPRPPELDPLCGAGALAVCLKALKRPYSKKAVLAACRVTGRGSSLRDVVEACPKLDVVGRAVTADDAGLIALPKPLVSFVENDHFVAVLEATKQRVVYSCTDCGHWPGGRVEVTWEQWRAMSPGAYVSVVNKGSKEDKVLAALLEDKDRQAARVPGVQVVAHGQVPGLSLSDAAQLSPMFVQLAGHVTTFLDLDWFVCGFTPSALHCPPDVCCLKDGFGPGGPGGGGPGGGPGGGGSGGGGGNNNAITASGFMYGLSAGDPVNLATGEEEYEPAPDLVVYNPHGPAVQWRRLYNSLRGLDVAPVPSAGAFSYEYPADDFGSGWSQGYNVGIIDPNPGAAEPLPADSVPRAGRVRLAVTGNEVPAPAPNCGPTIWDIVHNGVVVGLTCYFEDRSNGWGVGYLPDENLLIVEPPAGAALGEGYTVRWNGEEGRSADFRVVRYRFAPRVGTKYVVFPNGSRVPFTNDRRPTEQEPVVRCSAAPGNNLMVQLHYDPDDLSGYYTVSFADRTQWKMTGCVRGFSNGSYPGNPPFAMYYALERISDRNGNALLFEYGGFYGGIDPGGFPLLSRIKDASTGEALLSIERNPDRTGNITRVSDAYGRSVYYQTRRYNNAGMPSLELRQWHQELTRVSQIVQTGAADPPMRYEFDYALVYNGEGEEQVPMLSTIEVPSPTGVGLSRTTIRYAPYTCFVSSIEDANGNTRTYTPVDENGNPVQPGEPSQYTKVTMRDGEGGLVFSYVGGFNEQMSKTSVSDGAGVVTSREVYGNPAINPYRPTEVKDGNNRTWEYTWDGYGNMETETPPSTPASPRSPTTYRYDYDAFPLGQLIRVEHGDKTPTTYSYWPNGLVKDMYTPVPGQTGTGNTMRTSFTYDELGNLLTLDAPAPSENAADRIVTTYNYTTDPGSPSLPGHSQEARIRQPLTMTDGLSKTTRYRYDERGNVTVVVDPEDNRTDTSYTLDNQSHVVTHPGNAQTIHTYLYQVGPDLYAGGLRTGIIDKNEDGTTVREVFFDYGKEGEFLGQRGGTEPFSCQYDTLYRIRTLRDGKGNPTIYSYQPAGAPGYLSRIDYPGGDSVEFTEYDDNGNLKKRVDGRGWVTEYKYNDPEGLLTDTNYTGRTEFNVHLDYDAFGRRWRMTDGVSGLFNPDGSVHTPGVVYTYDDLNNPLYVQTQYRREDGNLLLVRELSYGYWLDGSRKQMNTPAGSFSYHYDQAGRMERLVNPFGEESFWSYHDNGWLRTQRLGNGVQTRYEYHARGWLKRLVNEAPDSVLLSDFSGPDGILYDTLGNRRMLWVTVAGVDDFNGETNYTYDSHPGYGTRSQLIQEQSSRLPSQGGYTHHFDYDGAGNPIVFQGEVRGYNTKNQLERVDMGYDGNGNPTAYQGVTLTFDPENRLRSYGNALSAGYSGDDLRGWKQVAGGRIYFLYDEDQPVMEMDMDGTVTAVNTFSANGLVSRSTGVGSVFYTFDPQGNTCQRLNAGADILSSHLFNAHGSEVRVGMDNTSNPYGYKGQWGYYTDHETGLLLLMYRYYDPTMGRFLTRDPLGYDGGTNLYAYVANNPVVRQDPTGLKAEICERPVFSACRGRDVNHWWLVTDTCGALGWGPGGVMRTNLQNLGDYGVGDVKCTPVALSPAQEQCVCDMSKRVQKGATMCGRTWRPNLPGKKGDYDCELHPLDATHTFMSGQQA